MTSEALQRCGRCKLYLSPDLFSPSYRGKSGTWCRKCFAAYHRGEWIEGQHESQKCKECGTFYIPKQLKQSAQFCSRACKSKARNAAVRQALLESKPDRNCIYCDKPMPKSMRADAKFCGVSCMDAAHNVTRQMAIRARVARPDELLARAYIFNRDRWICGLCGQKVSRTRKHPDPLAGSVDHIVPIAMGGTNDLTNLQLAHLQCNWEKRQHGGGQLRLLG